MSISIVTGVAGFIGSTLAKKLIDRGETILGIDSMTDYYPLAIKQQNLAPLLGHPQFTILKKDIADLQVGEIPDAINAVYHLAAQPGVRNSWGKEFSLYVSSNIISTQRLLEICRERSVQKFVYGSSSSVYGDRSEPELSEDMVPLPNSPYGVTKLAAERLCLTYFRNFGIPVIALRFFTVFGPRQRPDMAFQRMFLSVLNSKPFQLNGDGNQTRDFTFVDDVVDACIRASSAKSCGDVLNIGGGNFHSMLEVIDEVNSLVKPRHLEVKFGEPAKGDVRSTRASIEKAKQLLGFCPKASLHEGLSKQFDFLLRNEVYQQF